MSAPFQQKRLGLGPLPEGVHVKIQMGDGSSNFFGFEIWVNPVFFLGGFENWRYFLGHIKLWPQ